MAYGKKGANLRELWNVPADAMITHYDQAQSPCGCYTHRLSGVPATLTYYYRPKGAKRWVLHCASCAARWWYPDEPAPSGESGNLRRCHPPEGAFSGEKHDAPAPRTEEAGEETP